MNIHNAVEIHFHDQRRASVVLESIGGSDEQFGEILLFCAFAIRHLLNLGHGDSIGDSLASLLRDAPSNLGHLAGHRSPSGTSLVPYQGAAGRRRFQATLFLTDASYRFYLGAHGFGWLGRGMGFYSPMSVMLLLQHLVEHRADNPDFLDALGNAAALCGEAALRRTLDQAHANEAAICAAMLAAREIAKSVLLPACGPRGPIVLFPWKTHWMAKISGNALPTGLSAALPGVTVREQVALLRPDVCIEIQKEGEVAHAVPDMMLQWWASEAGTRAAREFIMTDRLRPHSPEWYEGYLRNYAERHPADPLARVQRDRRHTQARTDPRQTPPTPDASRDPLSGTQKTLRVLLGSGSTTCRNCGSEVMGIWKFCQLCGQRVVSETAGHRAT